MYSERSQISKMELFVYIVNGSNGGQLKIFFSKRFILDVQLHSKYASGTVNYFLQKLHLKTPSLIGLWIWLYLYWVWQFLNEIRKACYEETKENGNKYVLFVPSKIFVNFCRLIFLDFGWQIINWAACSMTSIFMNT